MAGARNALRENALTRNGDPGVALAHAAVTSHDAREFWTAVTKVLSDWADGAYIRISYAGRGDTGTVEGGPRFRAALPVEHQWQDQDGRTVRVAVVTEGTLPAQPPLGRLVEIAASLATLVGRRAVLERERRLTSFLVELSRWMLMSATDPQILLRYTLQSVMKLIGADGAMTLVRPPGTTGLQIRGMVGSATPLEEAMDSGIADACVRVLENGQPILVNDPEGDPDLARSTMLREWLRAAMMVPLKSTTGNVGVLCAFRSAKYHTATEFSLDDLSYLDAVAAHIASGIELAEAIRTAQVAARRAHAMVDSSPLPLALLTGGGDVGHVNDAFVTLLGLDAGDAAVGRRFDTLPLKPAGGTVAQLLKAARRTDTWEGPIIVERNGERRTCDGVITRLDETEAGELLLALYDRTDELRAQRELVAREKLATIGELASGVAHEVNNPLAAIRMEAELLGQAAERPETRDAVAVILKEVDRAAGIARSLLHLTRRSGTTPDYIHVNELLQDVVEIRSRVARSEGITIDADLDPEVPSLRVPAADLQQVLINLVTNAEHAVHGRENARIEVRSRFEQDVIRISVSDSGPGVEPAIRSRIFDPFFTTKDPDEGSGLGLALSRSIVSDLGGRIWVEDAPLGGAAFHVELPLAHGA